MELRNWYLHLHNDLILAWGDVYDSPRFSEGYSIHTSWIEDYEMTDSALTVITHSGSHYEMNFSEINHTHDSSTREALKVLNISDDFLNKEYKRVKSKNNAFFKDLNKELINGDLFLELRDNCFGRVCFKYNNKLYNLHCLCHVGMFADSYLYRIYGVVDFRHYEFEFNSVTTYHISDTVKRLVVKNTHTSPIQIDGVCYPAGQTTVSCATEKNHQEGLFSPDCVNGKSLLDNFNFEE